MTSSPRKLLGSALGQYHSETVKLVLLKKKKKNVVGGSLYNVPSSCALKMMEFIETCKSSV